MLSKLPDALPKENLAEVVIQATDLHKCYQTYQKPIHRLWQSFLPKRRFYDEFWALKGIDLTVRKGETVGIVGKNGSGKSTLLQILAGILQPTRGSFVTKGRVSALLELGAGFNPEFSGLENARLNASIMGLSREEFHAKLPDIVEFCGLGEFLHRPVKTYSSGMYVRLAFAVAINMDPDILIVDEALAVGDVRFQRQCFRRIEQLKEQGVSILLVTHSTESVIKFCDSAIMLNDGELKMTGSPKEVVQAYLELMFGSEKDRNALVEIKPENYQVEFDPSIDNCVTQACYNASEHRWGDARAKICHYEILQNGGRTNGLMQRGDHLQVRMWVVFEQAVSDLIYGVTVKTNDGNAIYGTNSRVQKVDTPAQEAGDLVLIEFNFVLHLLAGDYFISLGVAQDHDVKDNIAIDRRYDLIHIYIRETFDAFGFADLQGSLSISLED